MEIRITARHFTLKQSEKNAVEQRVRRLQQYFDGITNVNVILDKADGSTEAKAAELTVSVFRQTLVSNAENETVETAVDAAAEKMRRQLMRYKAKLKSKDKDVIR